jgi:glycosyltransferase involved in cell wall biosynthesis
MYTLGFDISAFDPAFKGHAGRGIGRYVTELYNGFLGFNDQNLKIDYFDHNTYSTSGFSDKLPIGKITFKQQVLFPTKLWLEGGKRFDAFHFPAHMDAPAWCKIPYILTVLDLIPLVLTDLYKADRPNWRFKLARWLEIKAIKNASLILAISENTAKDVVNILNIPEEKVRVTPLGVDQKFFKAKAPEDINSFKLKYKLPLDRPVMLYVGGIDQRKNYYSLIDVVANLNKFHESDKFKPPVLVMAGNISGDRQYPKLLDYIAKTGCSKHVILTGYVPDQDLLQLYKVCDLFLFLSLYEGFGLPVLEAMAAGLPVVTSNTSSIPEVIGTSGMLVNPTNVDEIVKAVISVFSSKDLSSRLVEEAKVRASQFSWNKTVDLTISAYKEFAQKSSVNNGLSYVANS